MSEYRKATHNEAVEALKSLRRGFRHSEVGVHYDMEDITPENFVERHNAMSLEEIDRVGRVADVIFLTNEGQWISVYAASGGFLGVSVREADDEA